MKKLISVLLVLCMMFSLAACSDSNNAATENTDNIVITQPTLDPSEDINVPAADPGEQPEELPTPEVDEEGETVGAETPEEPEESTQPEENEPSADPNASTAGDMLFSKFVEIAADSSLSAQEIADKLMADEMIPFGPMVMPIEPGPQMGLGEASLGGFYEGVMFGPMIGSIPFVGYIFSLDDGVSVDDFLNVIRDNYDLRWNICTEAEQMVCGSYENKVFFVMCPRSLAE